MKSPTQKLLAACFVLIVTVVIVGVDRNEEGQASPPERRGDPINLEPDVRKQGSASAAAASREVGQRTSEHLPSGDDLAGELGSGADKLLDSQQAERTKLATKLLELSRLMVSEVPPSLLEVELLLTNLGQAMHASPQTIMRDDDGNVVGALFTLEGTDVEAALTISGESAAIRFSLPPTGEPGLFVAGGLTLNLKLAGRHASSGGATFQHHPNTNQASSKYLEDGETSICGWSYVEREGGTAVIPIEMAASDDGMGWAIGNLGGTGSTHTPGGFNLAPYDSWAYLIATETLED